MCVEMKDTLSVMVKVHLKATFVDILERYTVRNSQLIFNA